MLDNATAVAAQDILAAPLRDFLETLAGDGPAPGGGSAAAITVAMAAGLVAKVAHASREHWVEAGGTIGQAEALRARVTPLVQVDAEAYGEALTVLRRRKEVETSQRDLRLGLALDYAADVPLRIAEIGSDVTLLAALLTEHGNPEVRGDAAAAAVLAEGGTRTAAKLVAINLAATAGDDRVLRAEALVDSAVESAERAVRAAQ